MGDVVVMLSMSLDGFVESAERSLDWQLIDDEVHTYLNEVLRDMAVMLHGRVTYQLMVDFWPTADTDPASTAPMVEFAGIWRDTPKVVYSRTLQQAGWNTRIVRDVVPDEVRRLKQDTDGDLSLGGANLAASFLRHGLVDEYRVLVHPVVIGGGTPLFQPGDRIDLRLRETRTFGNGVVLLRYRVGDR